MNPPTHDVIVLGAGAAGLFCAFHAARKGLKVLVLERANKAGKKILMSGGGRCNFTHLATGPDNFISQNPHFCKSALARYSPQAFLSLVERHSIAWFQKTPGQLFCKDSSKLIVGMLLQECREAGVEIRLHCEVDQVLRESETFALRTSQGHLNTPRLVVATGGLSVPTLGGSDLGYRIAKQFGHDVITTRPGLVPMTLSGDQQRHWCALSGISLPVLAETPEASFRDELLITHRGLSGPAILQASSYWRVGEPLRIALLPDHSPLELLEQARKQTPNRTLATVLAQHLPKRFAHALVEQLGIGGAIGSLNKKSFQRITAELEGWNINPSGTEGYRTAEVTLGGVDTRKLSSRSFESNCLPGLFFIGEVLDVTGWLGGYNFQWAWASAHACAEAL